MVWGRSVRFFEKERPEIYLHGAKLRRDKKTGKRMWGLTLIVTLNAKLVESCDVPVVKGWQYITEGDSAAFDVALSPIVVGCAIDFFQNIDDASPVLHLEGVDLGGLRITRDGTVVEFWFFGEHENSGNLHHFVKEFAFQRCWAQFAAEQCDLEMKPDKAVSK